MTPVNIIHDFFTVEIPDDARNVRIVPSLPDDYLYFDDKYGHDGKCEKQLTGFGNWSAKLIGLSDEITEVQAKEFVESPITSGYKNYEHSGIVVYEIYSLSSALESFQSLMRSRSLTKRYAIIKKVK